MKDSITVAIESILHDKIVATQPLSGGCIANSALLTTKSSQKFFAKSVPHYAAHNNSVDWAELYYQNRLLYQLR